MLREMIAKGEPPAFVRAGYQTAGRGQAGNGWESEREKNLLCSILIEQQRIDTASLFYLNVAVSVAVRRVLGEDFTIKWPNDIYWQDKKIAGILIENAIIGSEIKYSIAGIGLNVNQIEFVSDAPNPVSLKQITGKDYNIDELMQSLYDEVQKTLHSNVWEEYKTYLYRRKGFWPFVEREVSTEPTMNATLDTPAQFMARIEDITPQGELVLVDINHQTRTYHFKQIRFVL